LIIIPLAFISGVFTQDDLPDWLERIASVFPLKPFVDALRDTFNPFETGAQFSWDDLAVMAAWGVGGALVALRFFSWEPSTGGRAGHRGAPEETAAVPVGSPTLSPAAAVGRPGVVALVATHTGYALRAFVRNIASAFFVLIFPVVLLLLLPVVVGNHELGNRGGFQLTQFLAAVLAVCGAATAAYADFSQQLAYSRDDGVLKRIHGTPLPVWAFVSGRILTAICVALAALVVTVGVGMLVYGVELVPRALPGLLTSVAVGIACFAAL